MSASARPGRGAKLFSGFLLNNWRSSERSQSLISSDTVCQIANLPHGGAVYSSKNEVRDLTSSTREQAAKQLGPTPQAISRPENIIRRHLTTGERAAIADEIANLPNGFRADRSDNSRFIDRATKLGLIHDTALRIPSRKSFGAKGSLLPGLDEQLQQDILGLNALFLAALLQEHDEFFRELNELLVQILQEPRG